MDREAMIDQAVLLGYVGYYTGKNVAQALEALEDPQCRAHIIEWLRYDQTTGPSPNVKAMIRVRYRLIEATARAQRVQASVRYAPTHIDMERP